MLTRVKGGHGAPLRDSDRRAPFEQGLALLTSSAANEDAQESDALKGSFFTHHFVSALLGAADADGDGKVTLEEALPLRVRSDSAVEQRDVSGAAAPYVSL